MVGASSESVLGQTVGRKVLPKFSGVCLLQLSVFLYYTTFILQVVFIL